jgi:sigma-B regulation protein RsbU (phosphoserine phosphatase)
MKILSGQIAISLENARLYHQQGEAIRMQNELVTAHAVQGMLFPPSNFACPGVTISGYYQPATECGGDWWSYSKIGDWIYTYIGDATGHGAPAALVTSAACSAVSVIEAQSDVTPDKAMAYLNKAVCRTTKGQINMTFFVGALNSVTGEFRYVRASHEPPMLLRREKLLKKASLRQTLEPLMGDNGLSLGESIDEVYVSDSVQLQPGDTVVLYTDGLPEVVNSADQVLGERGFWEVVHEACGSEETPEGASARIIDRVQAFRGQKELQDDVTLCLVQFTGAGGKLKSAA